MTGKASRLEKFHKVEIGDCTLYRANAMHVMPALVFDAIQADCIVCDPPYLLTSGGNKASPDHKTMSGAFSNDAYNNNGQLVPCDIDWHEFMPKFYNLLRHGHAYVMSNNRNIQPMLNAAEKAGFGFHNLLVWDKGTATPNRWYMKNAEFTGLFYKGKAKHINDCGSMACVKIPHTDHSTHPTEKPVTLMEHYIRNSTKPGDLVIDPFMGSGTTGVAAVRAGRRFVGIELMQEYFDISVERIALENREHQPTLL